ncbi:MAG: hypothetical protein ACREK8_08395 [Gemmatimonadales bacterium]
MRDSLGIRIVESQAPLWTAESAQRLGRQPELMVGSSFGAPDGRIGAVSAAVRLEDGRIVVADWKYGAVKIFDAVGHVIRRIVPPTGPGALTSDGYMLNVSGDTILLFDIFQHRSTMLTADGKVVSFLAIDHPPPVPEHIIGLRPLGVLADGGLLGWSDLRMYRPEIAWHAESLSTWHVLPNGSLEPIATLLSGDAYSFVYPANGGPVMETGLRPFTVRSSVAAGQRSLWYTDGRHFEIREYNLDGMLRLVGRMQRTPATVTPAEITAFRNEQLAHAPSARAGVQAMLAWLIPAETHPAFAQLVVSRDGSVWAREDGDSTSVQHWDVFDPSARWLGEIDVPAGVDIMEIGAEYLLGRTRDPDGWTEHVVVYRFAH